MSESQTESIEALLALVDLAQGEVAEATAGFDDQAVDEFADLCRGHLETIGWAADMANLRELTSIANDLQVQYSNGDVTWNAETGAELVNWLSDLQLYLGAPGNDEALLLLLSPLPEARQAELQASWSDPAGEEAEMPAEAALSDDAPDGEVVFSDGDFAEGALPADNAFPGEDAFPEESERRRACPSGRRSRR